MFRFGTKKGYNNLFTEKLGLDYRTSEGRTPEVMRHAIVD